MQIIYALATFSWQQIVTDPSIFMRWVTVFVYLGAALLSILITLNTKLHIKSQTARLTHIFLWGVAAILLLLGINKLANYTGLFTQFGRTMAYQEGWFLDRRSIQYTTIQILIFSLLPILGLLSWVFRDILRYYWPTLIGTLFLVSFVGIRSISWHYVDALLNLQMLNIRVNWILELGSLMLIGVSLLLGHWLQRRHEQ